MKKKNVYNNYAFIDGQNLRRSILELGWKIDLKKFRTLLRKKYNVKTAYYFIGYIEANKQLYKMLEDFGFTLIYKEVLILANGKIKGNVDAELVLQAMKDFDNYDQAIIVSGDGDYSCLVKYLEANQKLKLVIAPSLAKSSVLIRRACNGKFAYLDEFRKRLEYKKVEPRKANTLRNSTSS